MSLSHYQGWSRMVKDGQGTWWWRPIAWDPTSFGMPLLGARNAPCWGSRPAPWHRWAPGNEARAPHPQLAAVNPWPVQKGSFQLGISWMFAPCQTGCQNKRRSSLLQLHCNFETKLASLVCSETRSMWQDVTGFVVSTFDVRRAKLCRICFKLMQFQHGSFHKWRGRLRGHGEWF